MNTPHSRLTHSMFVLAARAACIYKKSMLSSNLDVYFTPVSPPPRRKTQTVCFQHALFWSGPARPAKHPLDLSQLAKYPVTRMLRSEVNQ